MNAIWSTSQSPSVEEILLGRAMIYEPEADTREQKVAATLILLEYIFPAYCLYHYFNLLVLTIAAESILVIVSS